MTSLITQRVTAPYDNNTYFQNAIFYQFPTLIVFQKSTLIPIPPGNDFIDYIFQFPDQGSYLRDVTIAQLLSQGAFTAGVALLIYNPVEAVQGATPAVGNSLVFPPQLAQSTVPLPGFWVMITIRGGVIPQLETHPNIQIINDRTLMFAFSNSVLLSKIDVSHINIIINSFGVYVRDGLNLVRTFFISASGNDLLGGTTANTAWQTVSRVNSQAMLPGDVYQFNGGDTFSGTTLVPNTSGTAGKPVTFQSYGTGQGTINLAAADGFRATNRSNITVNNLNFTGPGSGAPNTNRGIYFTYTTSGALPNINITNCNVTGFGSSGIAFLPQSTSTNIISGVLVDNCVVNNCTWGDNGENAGIQFESWIIGLDTGIYQLQNVTISRCVVHDCPGLSGLSGTTGSGIFVRAVNQALITECVAYNNCLNGTGAVGIWCFDCHNITFQYCESYNNKGTAGSTDGGGFDIDGGCVGCTLQDCYSHGNWGNGFLIFGGAYSSGGGTQNCTIRFCISENDGQNAAGTHQSIAVVSSGGQKTLNALVYGNTTYFSRSAGGSCFDADAQGSSGAETQVQVFNNIFWATTAASSCLNDTVSNETGLQTTTYAGNDYYGPAATNLINWNSTAYHTLAAFQSGTGQEKVSGNPVGFSVNPSLANGGGGGTVSTGSFVTPAMLAGLTAYKLTTGSPMSQTGLNITVDFSVILPATDFYSNAITASTLSVGAYCGTPIAPLPVGKLLLEDGTSSLLLEDNVTPLGLES